MGVVCVETGGAGRRRGEMHKREQQQQQQKGEELLRSGRSSVIPAGRGCGVAVHLARFMLDSKTAAVDVALENHLKPQCARVDGRRAAA